MSPIRPRSRRPRRTRRTAWPMPTASGSATRGCASTWMQERTSWPRGTASRRPRMPSSGSSAATTRSTSGRIRTSGSSTATRIRWTTCRRCFDNGNGMRIMLQSHGLKWCGQQQRPAGRAGQHLRHGHERGRPASLYFAFSKYGIEVEQQLELEAGVDPAPERRRRPLPIRTPSSRPPTTTSRTSTTSATTRSTGATSPATPVARASTRRSTTSRPPRRPTRSTSTDLALADRRPDARAGPADDPGGRGPGHLHRHGRRHGLCGRARTTAMARPDTLQELALAIAAAGGPTYDGGRTTATGPMTAASCPPSCSGPIRSSCCRPTPTIRSSASRRRSTTAATPLGLQRRRLEPQGR